MKKLKNRILLIAALAIVPIWMMNNRAEKILVKGNATQVSSPNIPVMKVTPSAKDSPSLLVEKDELQSVLQSIEEKESGLEHSGLLEKARRESLSEAESKELGVLINQVLELRDRELQIRVRRLQARFGRDKHNENL